MADLHTPLSETPGADRVRELLASLAKPAAPISVLSAVRAPEAPQGRSR